MTTTWNRTEPLVNRWLGFEAAPNCGEENYRRCADYYFFLLIIDLCLYFFIFHFLQIILGIVRRFAMIYTTQCVVMMGKCTSIDVSCWRKHVSLTMTGWLKTSLTSAWMVCSSVLLKMFIRILVVDKCWNCFFFLL